MCSEFYPTGVRPAAVLESIAKGRPTIRRMSCPFLECAVYKWPNLRRGDKRLYVDGLGIINKFGHDGLKVFFVRC